MGNKRYFMYLNITKNKGGNMEFKLGDVVTLKCPSPEMVIVSIGEDLAGKTVADCKWFEKRDVKEGSFPLEALKKKMD